MCQSSRQPHSPRLLITFYASRDVPVPSRGSKQKLTPLEGASEIISLFSYGIVKDSPASSAAAYLTTNKNIGAKQCVSGGETRATFSKFLSSLTSVDIFRVSFSALQHDKGIF
jgi:hypothetical protein